MKILFSFVLVFLVSIQISWGQQNDPLTNTKTYINWQEAIKDPEKVCRLNLSNDHLKSLPKGLTSLKKLKVIDTPLENLNFGFRINF